MFKNEKHYENYHVKVLENFFYRKSNQTKYVTQSKFSTKGQITTLQSSRIIIRIDKEFIVAGQIVNFDKILNVCIIASLINQATNGAKSGINGA